MPGLWLGAAKSFSDDFFWSRRRFEIRVFDLLSVGHGERIDETVEWGIVATIGVLDGLLDAVITRNEDRVGRTHVGEVLGGIGFAPPFGEPFLKRLAPGKHRRKRFRILPTGDACQLTEEEGEIDLLSAE